VPSTLARGHASTHVRTDRSVVFGSHAARASRASKHGDLVANNELNRRRQNRRIFLLGGAKLGLVGVLISRLYYLQVIEADKYRTMSDQNRINSQLLPPTRGQILDRRGIPIALNTPAYRVELVAENSTDTLTTLRRLQTILPIAEDDLQEIQAKQHHQRSFLPITIAEDISWGDLTRIELNLPDLEGISVKENKKRSYPFGGIASHLLGYVAKPAPDDATDSPVLMLPEMRVGKGGLEKFYDENLRGTPGLLHQEVNASGRVVRELDRQESSQGVDLKCSVDIRLQEFAYQRLASQLSASAVVVDVLTGEILTMASVPGFDPSLFFHGIDVANWKDLTSDTYRPLTNKATTGQYAPGSTFKPITALSILKKGIDPTERVMCPGQYRLGNATFHCWKKGGHGYVDMIGAIQHSCDVYFYEMSRRVGVDAIAEMARQFGLGRKTEIDLPEEQPGLIPTTDWKKGALGESWRDGETLVAAIGQGFVLATPLQLALMTAQIANGGYRLAPSLTADRKPMVPTRLGIDPAWLSIVTEGMNRVTNDKKGTAYAARISLAGMEMAGKTGTSQVRRISKDERRTGVVKNDDLPWPRRDHALFIAYAPVSHPRFSCAVVVEHGGGGSAVAAPIARDILVECQTRFAQAASNNRPLGGKQP
jgi:penicillin-binding protein 2